MKVEIGQYREINKGALKGFFTIVINPETEGLRITDCKHFATQDKEWFSFPQKEVKKLDKSEYFDQIKYLNKDYSEQLKSAVLKELRDGKIHCSSGQKNQVQAQPSFDYGDAPF